MKGDLGCGRPAETEEIRRQDQVPDVVGIRKLVIYLLGNVTMEPMILQDEYLMTIKNFKGENTWRDKLEMRERLDCVPAEGQELGCQGASCLPGCSMDYRGAKLP